MGKEGGANKLYVNDIREKSMQLFKLYYLALLVLNPRHNRANHGLRILLYYHSIRLNSSKEVNFGQRRIES